MKTFLFALIVTSTLNFGAELENLKRDLAALTQRVTALEAENAKLKTEATFERLIVKKELIVSDTGKPWEDGFEKHQIARFDDRAAVHAKLVQLNLPAAKKQLV